MAKKPVAPPPPPRTRAPEPNLLDTLDPLDEADPAERTMLVTLPKSEPDDEWTSLVDDLDK